MVKNNWKWAGESDYATVYVDYRKRKTKVVTRKNIYIHEGVYPFHNPDYSRRMKRVIT